VSHVDSGQGCPRRALILGTGLTGLGLLLTACGAQDPDAPSAPDAAPSGTAGGRLAKVGDVPVGGGVVSPGGVLVLQLTEGNFTAFDAVCPHQAWRVSPPDASGVIRCSAHESHFRAADGSRIDGPAPGGLRPIPVQVKEGYVVKITM
jgi:nitrite reductase/ring-hydroxylating ferredoxin subunit